MTRRIQLATNRHTPTSRVGRALVLLLFGFVLSATAAHGLILTTLGAAVFGEPTSGARLTPGEPFTFLVLLLLCVISVVRVRRRFIQEADRAQQDSEEASPFEAPADREVSSFLARFLPGLAHTRIRLSGRGGPHVSHDTLFLNIEALPQLASMAARSAATPRAPAQDESPQERSTFVSLAHEEYHQLCFDASLDATFRALCFVLLMAQVPELVLQLMAPLSGEEMWCLVILIPLWFPFLMWMFIWGLHGGTQLLEHLADAHAVQRTKTPEAGPAPSHPGPPVIEQSTAPRYIDSRENHPSRDERLEFLRTLESKAAPRLTFFLVIILFNLAAAEGVSSTWETLWKVSFLGVARMALLTAAGLSALLASTVLGALTTRRHALVTTVLSTLFVLPQVLVASGMNLAIQSAWTWMLLLPTIGLWTGRTFLRGRLTHELQRGSAPSDLAARTAQTREAEEALRLALAQQSCPDARTGRFQRLLELATIHGRFFDAVFASALVVFIVIIPTGLLRRSDITAAIIPAGAAGVLLAIYFTGWSERRSGILALWGIRMATLGATLLGASLLINVVLYIQGQEPPLCAGNPSQQQLCIGQLFMDFPRLEPLFGETLKMVGARCEKARIIPEFLLQGSPPLLIQWLIWLRCAFHTPGRAEGPLFLAGALMTIFFDTGLSALRWLGSRRTSRP